MNKQFSKDELHLLISGHSKDELQMAENHELRLNTLRHQEIVNQDYIDVPSHPSQNVKETTRAGEMAQGEDNLLLLQR